jgi:hypothetical protein
MSAEAVEPAAPPARTRLTLVERAARTEERHRDCRSCTMFEPAPAGLAFGHCSAHKMAVKLYHPAGEFFSQCQFKVLTRVVAARG